ncbi:MAG: FliA/WhiG family RNA polymerase sigma factor [Planctomycetes bacterium]|nr:FliA/WhiG family RNA polymerase sigma factor [Planctomycetota bacterium]
MNDYEEDYVPPPPLEEKEETELWRLFKVDGDMEAKDRLVENYMALVFDMAERMSKRLPTFLDVQDLISSGGVGLLDAIQKFNPNEGVKFSTYCTRRINGAILDDLRRLDWPSRQIRQKVNQVKRTREELEKRLGRAALEHEMAEELGLSEEAYENLMQDVQIKSMVSLDRKWDDNDENDTGPIEMLPDTRAPDPLTELTRAEIKEVAMKGLSADEQRVLTLYYWEGLNLKEIGMALNLSESRVCQIHQKTLNFLEQKFVQRQISPYSL